METTTENGGRIEPVHPRPAGHPLGPAGLEIDRLETAAYTLPTEIFGSDGTLTREKITLLVVEAHAAGSSGLGYSYTSPAAGRVVEDVLVDEVVGYEAMAVSGAWRRMVRAVRSLGRRGLVATAVAAVDTALWDLKARLLGLSLVDLLGPVRDAVPIYGSGGFTSESPEELCRQLAAWVEQGIPRVKMKVGRYPDRDVGRVGAARWVIGDEAELMVDANGAYDRKQALDMAYRFAELGVAWFEEPVSSDDVEGLALLVERVPAPVEIAAGEYGYDLLDLRRLLEARAVDVLQADATRVAGITGFLDAGVLCRARSVPLSAHTAPALHVHPACAVGKLRHLEYFSDHVRIERRAFDGVLEPVDGRLRPARPRPGHGLLLKRRDLEPYRVPIGGT